MYAIVKTGGKQYKAAVGDLIDVEKIEGEEGTVVTLQPLCIVDEGQVNTNPEGVKVEATIVNQHKGKKQLVFKFKKRKNYHKLNGHRQQLTRVKVTAIG